MRAQQLAQAVAVFRLGNAQAPAMAPAAATERLAAPRAAKPAAPLRVAAVAPATTADGDWQSF
ncbi:MAG TPA: hypothetical protein VFU71_02795 [Burkholderiaceae bacterium]|nr:hypothetical protein [Burkholderiaceae bacterium]